MERLLEVLTLAVVGSSADPFRVATLERDDPEFAAEVAAASLTGGRRVVRIRDCTDRSIPALSDAARARSDCLVIGSSGALTGRSKLRAWAESEPQVAAVVCEPEGAPARAAAVRGWLLARGKSASAPTLERFVERLPGDERAALGEVEKLALYVADRPLVDDADLTAVLGTGVEDSLVDIVDAALLGNAAGAMAALDAAISAGLSGIGLLRILGGDLLRLSRALDAVAAGDPPGVALQRARVFPKEPRRKVFEAALRSWRSAGVARAIACVRQAEMSCKQTGANEALVTSRALGLVARSSRERAE